MNIQIQIRTECSICKGIQTNDFLSFDVYTPPCKECAGDGYKYKWIDCGIAANSWDAITEINVTSPPLTTTNKAEMVIDKVGNLAVHPLNIPQFVKNLTFLRNIFVARCYRHSLPIKEPKLATKSTHKKLTHTQPQHRSNGPHNTPSLAPHRASPDNSLSTRKKDAFQHGQTETEAGGIPRTEGRGAEMEWSLQRSRTSDNFFRKK